MNRERRQSPQSEIELGEDIESRRLLRADSELGEEEKVDRGLATEGKSSAKPYGYPRWQLWTSQEAWDVHRAWPGWHAWWSGRSRLVLVSCLIAFLFLLAVSLSRRPALSTDSLAAMPPTPFTGAFSIFPPLSALPRERKRLTLITNWNDDGFRPFLRHHLHTVQLNADSVDMILINRRTTPDARCIDFAEHNINITWGGNIRHYCMDDAEVKDRLSRILCSSDGWNCDSVERSKVFDEIHRRPDLANTWRPLWGYMFRDLFLSSDCSAWAWIDLDTYLGNFAHYPFNILSSLSLLTGSEAIPQLVFLAGQLTAFNLEDRELASAWKRFPHLQTAAHFTEHINGEFPTTTEEHYWSYGYLRSDPDLPGAQLSYAIYPDIHGDDFYDRSFAPEEPTDLYVLSGRELLLVPSNYTNEELEKLVLWERLEPIDDLGGIGWTGGEDGSALLLENPMLSASQAKDLAGSKSCRDDEWGCIHQGLVDDVQLTLDKNQCHGQGHDWVPEQCITPPHPDTISYPPIMRASYVHFREQQPNHLLRRLERDDRRRGYERKLLKHHHITKKWVDGYPDFDITKDLVLKHSNAGVEVFRMGPTRDQPLYRRRKGETDIG